MKLMAPELRKWDKHTAHATDSAAPGKSAEEEAAARLMSMEVAALLGQTAIMTSWDVAAFFDSVPLHLAIADSERLSMPACLLALGMQMHLAPRILRFQGACAKPLAEHGRSILAGCTMSTSVARGSSTKPSPIATREMAA